MKHSFAVSLPALGAALLLPAGAQVLVTPGEPGTDAPEVLFRVDIKTVTERGANASESPQATRLFLDDAQQTPAPLGTALWFVADLNGDGLPFQSTGLRGVLPGQMFGPDDKILFRDAVDGDQPGSTAGRYRKFGLEMRDEPDQAARLKGANLFMVLWNGAGTDFQSSVGDTFGLYEIGVRPPPDSGLGNAFWSIHGNVSATDFTLVPEPVESRLAGAAIAAIGALALRRSGRVNRR